MICIEFFFLNRYKSNKCNEKKNKQTQGFTIRYTQS